VERDDNLKIPGPRLKVLMLESGGWGGIHYYAHALGNGLALQAVELTLLTNEQYELEEQPVGFRLLRTLRRENYLLTLIKIARLLWRERPDVLHVQSLISQRKDLLLLHLCWALGVRLVLTVHNILPHEVRRFERELYFRYYRMVDGLILHSERNCRRLLEMLPDLNPERVYHIPHGNYAHFGDLELEQREARVRLGLPLEGRMVLFFGMIRPYKGLDLFLQLVKPVRAIHPEVFFAVAGNVMRGEREEYEEQIADLGLSEEDLQVRFAYLTNDEAIAYVCAADLVVLPYREIYQSGVLLFAFSFGRPVLATRVGSFPETVEEGENGWLVESEDVPGMERELVRILGEPDELEKAGRRARQIADEKYGWEGIAEQTVQVYADLMGEGKTE
jgi:D-inositol-3-phosphate glycosyltransferase